MSVTAVATDTILASTGSSTVQLIGAALITLTLLLVVWLLRLWAARPALQLARAKIAAGQAAGDVPSSRGLFVGADNRVSTSKVTAGIWTIVLVYLITTMALIAAFDRSSYESLVHSISPLYVVFLGGPFAAAVIAKSVVTTGVITHTVQKSAAAQPRIADIFSDDDGNTDLVDSQYFLFNILIAVIVLVQFIHSPRLGAPTVPDFLAVLTSASAATYVANKAVNTANAPSVSRIVPAKVRAGGSVVALGNNFVAQGDSNTPLVYTNLVQVTPEKFTADEITFRVPMSQPVVKGLDVVIRTPSNLEAKATGQLEIIPDEISVTTFDASAKHPGEALTLFGWGYYNALDLDATGKPIDHDRVPAAVHLLTGAAGEAPIGCDPTGGSNTDSQLTVVVPADVLAAHSAGGFAVVVERGGIRTTAGQVLAITPR